MEYSKKPVVGLLPTFFTSTNKLTFFPWDTVVGSTLIEEITRSGPSLICFSASCGTIETCARAELLNVKANNSAIDNANALFIGMLGGGGIYRFAFSYFLPISF